MDFSSISALEGDKNAKVPGSYWRIVPIIVEVM
jgi:hypothetical protein